MVLQAVDDTGGAEPRRAVRAGLLLAFCFCVSPLAAQVELEVGVVSDYIRRGYSRSGSTVVQSGARYAHESGFFGGLWMSTLDFVYDRGRQDQRDLELRGYAGYAFPLGRNFTGSALLVRYEYPDAGDSLDTAYTDASFSVQYSDTVLATVAYSPDYVGSDREAGFAELSWRAPLPLGLDLTVGAGHTDIDSAPNYTYGHVGLGRQISRFSAHLGYYLSDAPEIPRWGESVEGDWVVGLTARLP